LPARDMPKAMRGGRHQGGDAGVMRGGRRQPGEDAGGMRRTWSRRRLRQQEEMRSGVVGVFLEIIFVPKGVASARNEMLRVAWSNPFLVKDGDEARERLGLLNSLILEHHCRFFFVYRSKTVKPFSG